MLLARSAEVSPRSCPPGAKPANPSTALLNLERVSFPVRQQPQDSQTQAETQTREQLEFWASMSLNQMPM